MIADLSELKNEILQKNLKWISTPSFLNPPEFVGVFQKRLSIIDSKTELSEKVIEENQEELKYYSKCYDFICMFQSLENISGKLGKVSFWKIEKQGFVGYHVDVFDYHKLVDRYLINFNMLNDKCNLFVCDKKINFNPGQVIFLDHSKPHCVKNDQLEDVYFLSFDVFKHYALR